MAAGWIFGAIDNRCGWVQPLRGAKPERIGARAGADSLHGWSQGWWLVAGGWWLVAGGWWLVAGGWWLVAASLLGFGACMGTRHFRTLGFVPSKARHACVQRDIHGDHRNEEKRRKHHIFVTQGGKYDRKQGE